MIFCRFLKLEEVKDDSLFLWGARQVEKSTLLKTLFPEAPYYDLLKSEEFERLFRRPSFLREETQGNSVSQILLFRPWDSRFYGTSYGKRYAYCSRYFMQPFKF
jgi:hypothetical protein